MPMQRAVFHDPIPLPGDAKSRLAHISLPLLYDPLVNGLEDEQEDLGMQKGYDIAKRYRVADSIGKGSFSKVLRCQDLKFNTDVCVKMLLSDKDFLDSGLGEVRVLALIAQLDPDGEQPIVRMLDYFYFREHLFVVLDLCGDSLFALIKSFATEQERLNCLNANVLASVSRQLSSGLLFLHRNGIVHCDLKPENICLVSARNMVVKIIDLGSAVLRGDCHSSYVQSRWYRAPEVIVGSKWDARIDMWSLGTLVAELILGVPIFRGSTSEEVLASMAAVVGPVPAYMVREQLSSMFFTSEGSIFHADRQGHSGVYLLSPKPSMRLNRLLQAIGDRQCVEFISGLLEMDPRSRLDAESALRHSFLVTQSPTGSLRQSATDSRACTFTAATFATYKSSNPPSTQTSAQASPMVSLSSSSTLDASPSQPAVEQRLGSQKEPGLAHGFERRNNTRWYGVPVTNPFRVRPLEEGLP